jgi:FkbM family methyltransferase
MSLLRKAFRGVFKHYSREYGKYTILTKLFFPLTSKGSPKEVVRLGAGFTMSLDVSEYIQGNIFLFDTFEPSTIRFINRAIQQHDVVIDVGANVGYMALAFAKAAPSGKVIAFEPDPKTADLLRENIRLNPFKHVEVIERAAADSDKPLKLYRAKVDSNAGANSTVFNERMLSEDFVEIPAITLDTFVKERPIDQISFIKIDVEGGEMSVLKGATDTLKKFRPALMIELCAEYQNLVGLTVKQFKEFLVNGFQMSAYTIQNDGRLKPSPITEFHILDNVVFIPTEKLSLYQHLISA